jgi:hypothetical protein
MASKKCTKCSKVGASPQEFRPDRSVCRKCSAKDRRREGVAVMAFESDQELLEAAELGGSALGAFGTPIQRYTLGALLAHGSVIDAAEALQLAPQQLRAHMTELQRRAASRGYSPANDMTKTTPDGFSVKGVSTLYGRDGSIRGQWVKTKADENEKYQMLLDAMSTIAHKWEGLSEPSKAPAHTNDDLLAVYVAGDPHLGMHSWAGETGENFDLKIAEHELYTAADHLVNVAPAASHALVISCGDFYHADNRGSTTTGGTPVDSDGRWPKVLAAGIRLIRRIIDKALTKHQHVTFIAEIGNHDWHGSIMLALCIAQFYERDPRVTVDTSPAKCHYYLFGKNLIGTTHGDTIKLQNLPGVMACDRPEDWGRTLYRHWVVGHVHHSQVKEYPGCVVETFRTLAPADAWHKGQGYRSGRDMSCLVFHREFGQINRNTVGIQQVRAAK